MNKVGFPVDFAARMRIMEVAQIGEVNFLFKKSR